MLVLIGDAMSFKRGIGLIENNRNTILKTLICDKISSKDIKINDSESAFTTLGEIEVNLEEISPYDFIEPQKVLKKEPPKKTQEEKSDFDLGAFEFEFEKES